MDKQMYDAILTLSVEEQRRYFAEEYYDYEANRRYHRRIVSLDREDEDGKLQDIPDNSPTVLENILEELRIQEIKDAVAKLTERQQEFVRLIYHEGKSQIEVAEIYGITESAVSHAMDRIHNSLRRFLQKK